MSYQAVDWARHHSPMLLTDKGKPDSTAREILGELAEHADEDGTNSYPSTLHIRWATGYDERTIQRALLRLERAGLIKRDGVTRHGCVRWKLSMSMVRPESDWTDLEAEAEETKRVESGRRAARRRRAKPATSGTQSAGHSDPGGSEPGHVRDAECRSPGFSVPASGTQTPGVRDGTPPEPSEEPPTNPPGISHGGTLPPDPLRPQDPRSSDLGTEQDQSLFVGDQPHGDLEGDRLPRVRETAPSLQVIAGNPDAQPGGRGIWPAPVPDEPEPATPAEGLGFCVPCYRTGQTVLAADPDNGSACAYHLRSAS